MFSALFKKKKIYIPLVAGLVVLIFSVVAPKPAHAQAAAIADAMVSAVSKFAGEIILRIGSWAVWAAGIFLNAVVKLTIVDFKATIDSVSAINSSWLIIRDISNMVFIFVLIYIGIMTIVQGNVSGTKTLIRNVIIAALFINFSLFITQVVIDASNVVSVGFYNVIAPGGTGVNTADGGISNAFMNSLNLGSIFDTPSKSDRSGVASASNSIFGTKGAGYLITAIMGFFFMITAAIVFAAAGVMLLRRFIVLVFLMIFSPLAFVGIILPRVPAKKFWGALTAEAIYAPVFFIIVVIALNIVSGLKAATVIPTDGGFIAGISGSATVFMSIVLNFFIVIAFLIAAIKVARDLGGKTSSAVTSFAGGAIFGTVGAIGRNTIGRVASNFNDSERAARMRSGGVFQRFAANRIAGVAGSSFDARNARSAQIASGFADVNLGRAGGEGGYRKTFEDKTKRREEILARAGGATKETAAKVGGLQKDYRDAQIKLQAVLANPASTPLEKAQAQKAVSDTHELLAKSERKMESERKGGRAQLAARQERFYGKINRISGGFLGASQTRAAQQTLAKIRPSKDDAFDARIDAAAETIKADNTKISSIMTAELKSPKDRAALVKTFKDPSRALDMATLKALASRMNVADLAALERDTDLQPHQKDVINEVINDLASTPDPAKHRKDFEKYLAGPAGTFWQV